MKALGSEQLKPRLTNLAVAIHIGTAADFTVFLEQQRHRWSDVIARANIPKE